MKFHALAICVAGTLAAGIPAAADHESHTSKTERTYTYDSSHPNRTSETFFSSQSFYPDSRYLRDSYVLDMNFYPDLPSERYIADKLTGIMQKQRTEAAHLRSLAPQAQTAGFENINAVYNEMAEDHTALADFVGNWLRDHGFPAPASATAENISMAPAASVDHMIQMHEQGFNEALAGRQGEKSATVRTVLLWAAATSLTHLDWLNRLNRDVDSGRTALSTELRSMIDETFMAGDRSALIERIIEEEYTVTTTTPAESPTYVLNYPEVVETIVERPVIVERTVEAPAATITSAPIPEMQPIRSQVAGRRETLRRVRRPAK
jgi:hypothetical protein